MRRGLGFHNRHSPSVFNPATLFGNNINGVWYDPSDLTTLFSDTAGLTPCAAPGAGAQVLVGRMLDKSGNNNHAISYNATTARPELSTRVNFLTYSEDQSNAVWVNYSATQQSNVAVAPDGTNTADRIVEGAGTVLQARYQSIAGGLSIQYTVSAYAKAGERSIFNLSYSGSGGANWFAATFDLTGNGQVTKTGAGASGTYTSSSITPVGNGWYFCQVTGSPNQASAHYVYGGPSNITNPTYGSFGVLSYTGNTSNGVLVWGFDVRPANIGTGVPAYQRIADQYTYDSSGFPRYLSFNGTANGMYTAASVNLSSTAQATVFAGVRKQSDAALGVVAEFSAGIATNNGSFLLSAPNSAAANYNFSSKGTTQVDNTVTTYTAPISNVVTGLGNISAPSNIIRVNGAQVGSVATTQGTGNYGTFALNLGARNAQSGTPTASTYFNGRLFGLVALGAAASDYQIWATEQWMAQKTGLQF